MSAAEIDKLYQDTEIYVNNLEAAYLTKHIDNKTATPDDFDLDVRSYCILCHSAIEDFIESVALKVMTCVIDDYVKDHKVSESLLTLLHFKSTGSSYFNGIKATDPLMKTYDYIRIKTNEIKQAYSSDIVDNNGASIKYLYKLLLPIAIDITDEIDFLDSLKQLANERGFFAHKFRDGGTLKRSIQPEKAKIIVEDCLLLCLDIRDKAKQRIA